MRIVVIGDIHAHQFKRYPETDAHGMNLRLLDAVNELDRIRTLAVKNKVEAVCILGDIFEARNALDVVVLNAVYKVFRGYSLSGVRLILLVGNHDRCDVGREHALEVFKPFAEVVDTPRSFDLRDGTLVAIPFSPSPQKVVKAIEKLVTKDTKLLLLHTQVQSLRLPNGKTLGGGIPLDVIPSHVLCLMGDIHMHQQLRERVYYVGSLLQKDAGDAGQEKYFAVYDSDTHRVKFVPTRGPRFVAVGVEFLPDVAGITGTYTHAEFVQAYQHQVRGNFVTVTRLPQECLDHGVVERSLRQLGARHVEFAFQTQLPMFPPRLLEPDMATPAALEVVQTYVEEADTSLDKETLITHGMEMVTSVMESDDGVVIEVD